MKAKNLTPIQRQVALDRTINSRNIEKSMARYGVTSEFIGELLAIEAKEVMKLRKDNQSTASIDARYRHLMDTLMKFMAHKETNDLNEKLTDNLLKDGNKSVEEKVAEFIRKQNAGK